MKNANSKPFHALSLGSDQSTITWKNPADFSRILDQHKPCVKNRFHTPEKIHKTMYIYIMDTYKKVIPCCAIQIERE